MCDADHGRYWNRPQLVDLISVYIAEEEFDGEIPANVEVVLIFEEDDVQVTVPGTVPTSATVLTRHSSSTQATWIR